MMKVSSMFCKFLNSACIATLANDTHSRGKKMFRRFQSPTAQSDEELDIDETSHSQAHLRHQAGAVAQRPLTRSSLRPRVLFPSEEHQPAIDEEDEEEAQTDIESEHVVESEAKATSKAHTTTPARHVRIAEGQVTPPTTRKSTRFTHLSSPEEEQSSFSSETTPKPKGKKRSPFDSWQRTKPGMSGGRKRAASPEREVNAGKRTRSGAH